MLGFTNILGEIARLLRHEIDGTLPDSFLPVSLLRDDLLMNQPLLSSKGLFFTTFNLKMDIAMYKPADHEGNCYPFAQGGLIGQAQEQQQALT